MASASGAPPRSTRQFWQFAQTSPPQRAVHRQPPPPSSGDARPDYTGGRVLRQEAPYQNGVAMSADSGGSGLHDWWNEPDVQQGAASTLKGRPPPDIVVAATVAENAWSHSVVVVADSHAAPPSVAEPAEPLPHATAAVPVAAVDFYEQPKDEAAGQIVDGGDAATGVEEPPPHQELAADASWSAWSPPTNGEVQQAESVVSAAAVVDCDLIPPVVSPTSNGSAVPADCALVKIRQTPVNSVTVSVASAVGPLFDSRVPAVTSAEPATAAPPEVLTYPSHSVSTTSMRAPFRTKSEDLSPHLERAPIAAAAAVSTGRLTVDRNRRTTDRSSVADVETDDSLNSFASASHSKSGSRYRDIRRRYQEKVNGKYPAVLGRIAQERATTPAKLEWRSKQAVVAPVLLPPSHSERRQHGDGGHDKGVAQKSSTPIESTEDALLGWRQRRRPPSRAESETGDYNTDRVHRYNREQRPRRHHRYGGGSLTPNPILASYQRPVAALRPRSAALGRDQRTFSFNEGDSDSGSDEFNREMETSRWMAQRDARLAADTFRMYGLVRLPAEIVNRQHPDQFQMYITEPAQKAAYLYNYWLYGRYPDVHKFKIMFGAKFYGAKVTGCSDETALERVVTEMAVEKDQKMMQLSRENRHRFDAAQRQLFSDERESPDLPDSSKSNNEGAVDLMTDDLPATVGRQRVSDVDVAESDQASVLESLEPAGPTEPKLFDEPHTVVRFAPGGRVIVAGGTKGCSIVQVQNVQNLLAESADAVALAAFRGPLTSQAKQTVLLFVRRRLEDLSRQRADVKASSDVDDCILLWQLLQMAVQQNGVVSGPDISTLLNGDAPLERPSPPVVDQVTTLAQIEQLLMGGHHKEAIEVACKAELWHYAIMLALNLEPQNPRLVQSAKARMLSTMAMSDPILTLLQVADGSQVAVASSHWRRHAAVLLANFAPDRHYAAHALDTVGRLSAALVADGRPHAADFCLLSVMLLSGRQPDMYRASLSLLHGATATDSASSKRPHDGLAFSLFDFQATEVFDFAMGLVVAAPYGWNQTIEYQLTKFAYASLLSSFGFAEEAFLYCVQIAVAVYSNHAAFDKRFVHDLREMTNRLDRFKPDGVDFSWLNTCFDGPPKHVPLAEAQPSGHEQHQIDDTSSKAQLAVDETDVGVNRLLQSSDAPSAFSVATSSAASAGHRPSATPSVGDSRRSSVVSQESLMASRGHAAPQSFGETAAVGRHRRPSASLSEESTAWHEGAIGFSMHDIVPEGARTTPPAVAAGEHEAHASYSPVASNYYTPAATIIGRDARGSQGSPSDEVFRMNSPPDASDRDHSTPVPGLEGAGFVPQFAFLPQPPPASSLQSPLPPPEENRLQSTASVQDSPPDSTPGSAVPHNTSFLDKIKKKFRGNQVHLPDDRKKTIEFDASTGTWRGDGVQSVADVGAPPANASSEQFAGGGLASARRSGGSLYRPSAAQTNGNGAVAPADPQPKQQRAVPDYAFVPTAVDYDAMDPFSVPSMEPQLDGSGAEVAATSVH